MLPAFSAVPNLATPYYPEYLVIDSYSTAMPFMQSLTEIIKLLYPNMWEVADPNYLSSRYRRPDGRYPPAIAAIQQQNANGQIVPRVGGSIANSHPHITVGWISKQWFEELNYQIFGIFTTDFLQYTEQLKVLPNVSNLLFIDGLYYNTALLRELQDHVSKYALAIYFLIREQGFFDILSQVEYVLHHPAIDGLMLYRGQTPYHIPQT